MSKDIKIYHYNKLQFQYSLEKKIWFDKYDNNNIYFFLCLITNCNNPNFYFKIGFSKNILLRKKQLNKEYNCYDYIFLIGCVKRHSINEEHIFHRNIKHNIKYKYIAHIALIVNNKIKHPRELYVCNEIVYNYFFDYFITENKFVLYNEIEKYINDFYFLLEHHKLFTKNIISIKKIKKIKYNLDIETEYDKEFINNGKIDYDSEVEFLNNY